MGHHEKVTKRGDGVYRILCLDGGGAKGFYTLGVLRELEAMLGGGPLCEQFDLIYGTSTGSIIASLLALGESVIEVHKLYKEHVPTVMKARSAASKSAALAALAHEIYKDRTFNDMKTHIGVVATEWRTEKPKIFKTDVSQAHGRTSSFEPGFGCLIADAVEASCSAYPYFTRKVVVTVQGDQLELIDGGYCANNPTLYAIADATIALGFAHEDVRVVSVGVGTYPEPKRSLTLSPESWMMFIARRWWLVQLLQKTMEINTQSMDQLRSLLYQTVPTVRISETYSTPEMATDLLEHNLDKLNIIFQRGKDSFALYEKNLRAFWAEA